MILIFVTNQEIYPANVASVILGIKGVLEMESFPKEYFIDKIVGNSKEDSTSKWTAPKSKYICITNRHTPFICRITIDRLSPNT